jgi:hypothetical protein
MVSSSISSNVELGITGTICGKNVESSIVSMPNACFTLPTVKSLYDMIFNWL